VSAARNPWDGPAGRRVAPLRTLGPVTARFGGRPEERPDLDDAARVAVVRTRTRRRALASMLTSMSMVNSEILPRTRSLTRG
jgi:hypothetical protein